MPDRKVYVTITTRLIIRADQSIDIESVMENMDYSFTSQTEGAEIEETQIQEWNIKDSK